MAAALMFRARVNLVFHLSNRFVTPEMVVTTLEKHLLPSVMLNAQNKVIVHPVSCAKSSSSMTQRVRVPFEFVAVTTAKAVYPPTQKLFLG